LIIDPPPRPSPRRGREALSRAASLRDAALPAWPRVVAHGPARGQAGVDHRIETYEARHGFVFRDTPVYDTAAAERHWRTLIALLDAKLKHGA
jgi:carboxymethylenebutenolidase